MIRCMRRQDGKWLKEDPPNLSKWLWQHDGTEAVAVDDKASTYYCAMPVMMEQYKEAWAAEKLLHDPRKAKMFIDLDIELYTQSNPGKL